MVDQPLIPITFPVFSEAFPELVQEAGSFDSSGLTESRFGILVAPMALEFFKQCFSGLLKDPLKQSYLLLWTAHLAWVFCNMETGGTLAQVKQVNSSETYNTLKPDRFLSNLSLSPYGQLFMEMTTLSYTGAGHIVAGIC